MSRHPRHFKTGESEFGVNNSKSWRHPALYQRFRMASLVVLSWSSVRPVCVCVSARAWPSVPPPAANQPTHMKPIPSSPDRQFTFPERLLLDFSYVLVCKLVLSQPQPLLLHRTSPGELPSHRNRPPARRGRHRGSHISSISGFAINVIV